MYNSKLNIINYPICFSCILFFLIHKIQYRRTFERHHNKKEKSILSGSVPSYYYIIIESWVKLRTFKYFGSKNHY